MILKSLQISHFKSLDEVTIELNPGITVLVGQNAAGKSNVVDALNFLRDMAEDGLDHALSKRGGINLIRQYSRYKPYKVSIKLGLINTIDSIQYNNEHYEITLTSLGSGNYKIDKESVFFHDYAFTKDSKKFDEKVIAVQSNRNSVGKTLSTVGTAKETHTLKDDLSVLTISYSSALLFNNYILRFISNIHCSTIYPNIMREPSRPDTDRRLKENGINWASIIKSLRKSSEGRAAFERIKEMMQLVMPSLQDITVKSVGGYLVPQFRVKESADAPAHDFDPSQLSDGTLRIFGILLALYQLPSPSLLILEEPEQTVNPAVLGMLSEAFREVSEKTQIILTTHSPHLVEYFEPEEIRVVTMDEGKTRVAPIRRAQFEAVKEHLISLEQLMLSEGLLPEDVA